MKLRGIQQFGRELAAIARNKKILIPVIAVLTVPVMYSAMFLGAFWDPYQRLADLPVAVINSDEGYEYEGESMQIGQDFEDKLKDNKTFKWDFISKEEALQGMKDNKYYMAIEIPKDFSEKTTSLTSDKPEQAQLVYLPNESFNFLASQIGNTAVEQMKGMLNKEVTEAYTRTVFDKLEDAADGIVKASDGATKLADGTTKAKDGAQLLEENLNKLASGTVSLQEGSSKLNNAGGKLVDGSSKLKDGATELANGMGLLSGAADQLAGGAKSAQGASGKIAGGLEASAKGTAELETGAKSLAAGLEQLLTNDPSLADNENFKALVAASKQLAGGLSQSSAGQKELSAGAASLSKGLSDLSTGAATLDEKLAGAKGGAEKLSSGLNELNGGASELAAGLTKLDSSVGELTTGTKKLEDGATQITSGLLELNDGSHELSEKLGDASKQTSDLSLSDDMVNMFADPINLNVDRVTEVPNYGTGFAPYFLSLGLYVGALLITIVYSVREPAIRPTSGWSWFWSKALTLMLVGTIQALIADAALIFILKLEVQNMPLFILFSIITSITFMMLIQFFVTTLGNPGRFVAIVLLILQLTSSAGTFPVELTPGWLQHVTPWLPMTYSVAGLKDVISSGDVGRMWGDVGVLAVFGVLFAVMTLIYFITSHRREAGSDSQQELKTV
ncbi:YhgE/Pip domain-containing protein [Paenibacillus sp. GSMTC-2017]|uniref:YhgE/Pip family protein n=1 Tax=Paenibacillus sp. GSMTC-2017 TaxID=2794350 RepID=UPI0018D73443|nr:YhgE/Pip domain-containing protein [Paenibacillus sp. GSMTC-2017]MBH5318650.1 YhgE/Pip domain-containing protein [Paenibacillus sp. GSMTC-2017]